MLSLVLSTVAFGKMLLSEDPLAKHVYPLAKPMVTPTVIVDTSDFPESKAWGEKAKEVVTAWYPTVTALLSTDEWKAPKQIKIVIKKEISAPANEPVSTTNELSPARFSVGAKPPGTDSKRMTNV